MSTPRFRLYYWPLPFRGCFVSYQFAYQDVPLLEESDLEAIETLRQQPPSDQPVPFMGPPVLEDLETGEFISQAPAIVSHIAGPLGLLPGDRFQAALCMKVLMDCNDLLMELCRYNGSWMWDREAWIEFRGKRLPRWMHLFEESLARGHVGGPVVSYADIAVFALFGNMTRCLPELAPDLLRSAPGIGALCQRIGAKPSMARRVRSDQERFGQLYCGGQIEASIRSMLALDDDG
ncbi:MAG: glutathione S-transferase family protein [Pseudomonadota bacterium]